MRVVETGCWCWCLPGAGAGAVSWLCALLVLVPGAGCRWAGCARDGDRLLVPVAVVLAGCRCWCCELAVHVVETGCWCWCWVPVWRCRKLAAYILFEPVPCQQVVGFCLAIWIYAGVIFAWSNMQWKDYSSGLWNDMSL